jgi:hypothetical protein
MHSFLERGRLSASVSASVVITEEQRQVLYQEIYKWNGQSSSGEQSSSPDDKGYRLIDQNYIDFVAMIAERLGYPTPDRTAFQTPDEFIRALRTTIEEEQQRRKTEGRIRAAQERANAAGAKERAAETSSVQQLGVSLGKSRSDLTRDAGIPPQF